MTYKTSKENQAQEQVLRDLGQQIRNHRKRLKISAIATAEAAGMSRITLYRIEQGEASVAMGAYLSVVLALGMTLELKDLKNTKQKNIPNKKLPEKIRIADYKQLKLLAWQLKGTKEISPQEALNIYERNWRHIDIEAMDSREQKFLKTLLAFFGRERLLV